MAENKNSTQVFKKDHNNCLELFNKVANHIDHARQAIYQSVNIEMVKAYWLIGRDIILHEQDGSVSFRRACVTRLPNPCKFYFYLQEKMYARAYP